MGEDNKGNTQGEENKEKRENNCGLGLRVMSFLFLIVIVGLVLFLGRKNAQVSGRYQLFVTPPGIFFAIWGVIYLSQIIVNAINLYKNVWSKAVHGYLALANILQLLWTVVFNMGTDGPVFAASFILFAIVPAALQLWVEMGRKTNYGSSFVVASRNVYAFFLGWIIAAANLSLGVLIVYWWGFSKQIQTAIFWIIAPLCAIGGTLLNYKREGKRGVLCCWALWLSVLWAFSGAAINSSKCLNGTGGKC